MAVAPLMMAAAIGGTALSAIGSVVEGQAQAKGFKSEARIADANAIAVSQQAGAREEQLRRETRKKRGEQAGAIAQSGLGFTGSNLDVLSESATLSELDALNIRYEGALQRTSYNNDALGLRRKATDALRAGWIGAGTKVLQGVGSYASGGGKLPGMS